jgi:hypothetical protein
MAQGFNTLLTSNTVYDDVARHNENYASLRSSFSGTSFPSSPEVGQMCWRTDRGQSTTNGTTGKAYLYTGDTTIGESGWIDSETTGFVQDEVVRARGTKLTLDQRLDISLNEDGTLRPTADMGSEWILPGSTFTRVDNLTFTTNGNTSDIYLPKRRLKVNGDGVAFTQVVSSSFDGIDTTTIVVQDNVVSAPLVSVEHSIISPFRGTTGGAISYYTQVEAAEKNGDATKDFAILNAIIAGTTTATGDVTVNGTNTNVQDLNIAGITTATGDVTVNGTNTNVQDLGVAGNAIITGDLTVNGTTTTIDSTTLIVEDKNIELGAVTTPTDTTADGGGITLHGDTDKTIVWDKASDEWVFNKSIQSNVSGNASSATKLETARTLGGISFDGTASINLPGVNIAGNQDTSGNAATASDSTTLEGQSWSGITTQYINMTHSSASITMDDQTAPDGYGVRRVTCNDGGGNWNFRSGSYFNGADKYTTAGWGATNIISSTDSVDGSVTIKTAVAGTNADDAITWGGTFSVSTVQITYNGSKVWHAGNDGSGSGLDADTVDGTHLSAIAKTAQTSSTDTVYTDKTTGTNYKMYVDNGSIILEEL